MAYGMLRYFAASKLQPPIVWDGGIEETSAGSTMHVAPLAGATIAGHTGAGIRTMTVYGDAPREHSLRLIPRRMASLLDVGSGSGHFLEAVKASCPDIETWAIDPNQDCSQRKGVDHFVSGTYPIDLPIQSFDVIVFNDVLEHMVDPWSVLRDTLSYLSRDGTVIASIPNIRHYSVVKPLVMNGKFTYREAGLLDRTHLRFFTIASAVSLFVESGYIVNHASHERLTTGGASRLLRLGGRASVPFRARHISIAAQPKTNR